MQVILNKDIKTLGKKGDLVNVSDGYATNYLIPANLARVANATNKNLNMQARESEKFKRQQEKDAAIAIKNKLDGLTLNFSVKIGESGKLFGALTTKEIAEKLNQMGVEIPKNCLVTDTIKTTGAFDVTAKLYPEVSAKFVVVVDGQK